MFLHLSVILFTGGGFPGCITGHMREGLYPRGSASREQIGHTLQIHGILRDTVNKWAVRIILECILVLIVSLHDDLVGIFHAKNTEVRDFSILFQNQDPIDKATLRTAKQFQT